MTWIPSIEYIIALLKDQIKDAELMNRDGLKSTLDKVIWGIPTQNSPTIWDQVTILFKEIVEYHYFSDGNKRMGILLSYLFLQKNGYEFTPPKQEVFSVTMDIAQGRKTFEALKEWFINHSNEITHGNRDLMK
ncbi:MAG: type II toxin-antitoxin system death-on-curing family toxin [Candidatus Helarchaeota archaeon]